MSEMTRARPGASRAARPGAMRLIDATKYRLPLTAVLGAKLFGLF